jgi:hypothetical protein
MKAAAKAHLARAKEYVAKGEQFYRKAAEQIMAARSEGSTWTEINSGLGRGEKYAERIVKFCETPAKERAGTAPFSEPGEKAVTRHAKQALREKPEIVAQLTPAEQRALARTLDQESAKRQKARKESSKQKEREHLGDETVDDLAFAESLKSTEYLLIKARGNIAGFVRDAQELGVDSAPESWRESCLVWITDLKATLGMAEGLLSGEEIDDAAINEWLAKDVS